MLIKPYMEYLQQSLNLSQDIKLQYDNNCTCMNARERFLDMNYRNVQLMHRGLFGNAPKEPTLAVDLRLLDFVTRLFQRLAPNNIAICQTMEDFLRYEGYQLRGQSIINNNTEDTEPRAANLDSSHLDTSSPPSSPTGRGMPSIEEVEDEEVRPSKRTGRGLTAEQTFRRWIKVTAWKEQVSAVRPKQAPPQERSKDDVDGFENGLKVPRLVLDGCNNSFTVADGNREKASTKFFHSTALMGLLCCHDRMLWLALGNANTMHTPWSTNYFRISLQRLPSDYSTTLAVNLNEAVSSQSRSAGQKAVEAALRLRKACDTLCDSIKDFQCVLASRNSEPYEIAEAKLELPELREKLSSTQQSHLSKERTLGVEGKKRYNHLASSPFITDLMNARALKVCLCQKLQSRKFEQDRLDQMYRRQINSAH
ncbi:hypothetical protein BDP27DRAFT_1362771 [Rhodocollybia butyracea]|uniref:Uncharacterized protein n=1 Tax=Rhodocollybia butyracea TaxID=206335 RepID=A0A9P5PQA3_9AGAR|nr:hypothetical protein BDP27DRAFT_1362771 [Rhodocollybia butyracea]